MNDQDKRDEEGHVRRQRSRPSDRSQLCDVMSTALHSTVAMTNAQYPKRRAVLPLRRPKTPFSTLSPRQHGKGNSDSALLVWLDVTHQAQAIQRHLRQEMQVNIQTYLQDPGIAPTTAAVMSADIIRDV
ncbi:hypothetical protein CGMCC3_g17402 [Colletotrichum fructicola]|uniref:Uncharacterized protein n=1 Tax=Colletotrichum fructicola (strain Nara gc5) TaxID=1213859 RepID=L2G9K0_COLFN|nr:uncharacterized protein CGMCC3_g17402 [Colletotrichum fructicola]KAE9566438.1 hypothetical protein CGMCC3_g17402 [Colletotrichum fructicola]KAF4417307.1 hypothetical protein CFRS1_v015760 [Colletotrichum fructicola]KAF4473628.1 hypothetical protein CGGC5_v017374 [Colletotrichum fructicola Nara gc5]KAF5482888.1 hypothetical protein CGCF413_v015554 [Colletotrichum fructicola]